MEKELENIKSFAEKHGLKLELNGEVGFGRECIGFLKGDNYIDYNPMSFPDYDYVQDVYDERFEEVCPPDAYHKHTCLAVLGRGEEAIKQLSNWVDKLNIIGVEVVPYKTGATGIQAMFTGAVGNALKVKS